MRNHEVILRYLLVAAMVGAFIAFMAFVSSSYRHSAVVGSSVGRPRRSLFTDSARIEPSSATEVSRHGSAVFPITSR